MSHANYHLSRKDYLHHHAKKGFEQLGKALIGGVADVDHEAHVTKHAEHHARHREADEMEHLFLCPLGKDGPHTFKPEIPHTHLTIVATKVVLPGGEVLLPHQEDGVMMPLLFAICAEHGAAEIARACTHDWNDCDEHCEPLVKEELPEK